MQSIGIKKSYQKKIDELRTKIMAFEATLEMLGQGNAGSEKIEKAIRRLSDELQAVREEAYEDMAKRQEARKEYLREHNKRYYELHKNDKEQKEEYRIRKKRFYANHPGYSTISVRNWRASHPDRYHDLIARQHEAERARKKSKKEEKENGQNGQGD